MPKSLLVTQEFSVYLSVELPSPWNADLNLFQKMLVLKCLRPDKVTNAMQIYVTSYLGQRFVEPQTSDLNLIYQESDVSTPIIFVLSTGTDPAAELHKFTDKLKMAKKFYTISLGQGQGIRAEQMIKSGMSDGHWIFLQVSSQNFFYLNLCTCFESVIFHLRKNFLIPSNFYF